MTDIFTLSLKENDGNTMSLERTALRTLGNAQYII